MMFLPFWKNILIYRVGRRESKSGDQSSRIAHLTPEIPKLQKLVFLFPHIPPPPLTPPDPPHPSLTPELGRFKAFRFYHFGPGGRGPSGSNLARKSGIWGLLGSVGASWGLLGSAGVSWASPESLLGYPGNLSWCPGDILGISWATSPQTTVQSAERT